MISILDLCFDRTDRRTRLLLTSVSDDVLFAAAAGTEEAMFPRSCAACILRSAAMVEQAFGGLTTRLWDDPFEWTLPEQLNTRGAILEYLDEVKTVRAKGFAYISSDADLLREVPAPADLKPLGEIILTAITSAEHFLGQAHLLAEIESKRKLPFSG